MYKKHLEELVARLIGKHFQTTVYKRKTKFDKLTGLIYFRCETVNYKNEFTTYKGYVGIIGEVVVTDINGEFLKLEDYITIL